MLMVLAGGTIWNETQIPVDNTPKPDPDPSVAPSFRFATRSNSRTAPSDFTIIKQMSPNNRLRTMWSWRGATGATPSKTYNFGSLDTKAANAAAAGVPLLGVLSQTPIWANSQGSNFYPAGFQDYFYDFCGKCAARFIDTVEAWEIYNEPNLKGWTTAQVQEILIGAAAAIRAANPNAIILGGCPLGPFNRPTGSAITAAGWGQFFDNPQVRSAMDVASFHYYPRPSAPELHAFGPLDQVLQSNFDFAASHGWTGPMWITEAGWPAPPTEGLNAEVSEADQARFLVRYAIICTLFPKLQRYYQFQIFGSVTPGDEEGGMGLIRPDNTFKPSWAAWIAMANILDQDLLQTQRIPHANPACWIIKYWRKNQRQGYIYWTTSGSQNLIFNNVPDTVRSVSFSGVQTIVPTTGNSIGVTATIDPQYLELWWTPSEPNAVVLSDPLATQEAKDLWSYLNGLKSRVNNKVLSGQRWVDYNNTINAAVGKYPAILNLGVNNTQDGTFDNFAADAAGRQTDMLNWWSAGGVVVFDLFLRDPISKGPLTTNGSVAVISQSQMISARTEGTAANTNLKFMLDKYVAILLWLQTRNVPVIVRHMIEHNGSGFWYLDNPDLINFYKYCRTYIINQGVHNALWTHCPSNWGGSNPTGPASDPHQYMVFYPGDDTIDIVGFDLYAALESRNFNSDDFEVYRKVHGDKPNKPIMIFELGVKTDYTSTTKVDLMKIINGIKSYAPDAISWFCWSVVWSMRPADNNNVGLLLNDPWVITRDETGL